MSLIEISVAVAVGIVANLLTPAVRNSALRVAMVSVVKLRAFGEKAIKTRLRQLQDEKLEIEALNSNPKELANRIAYYIFPQVISLWIALFALLIAELFFDANIFRSPWAGGIAGIIGYATRYPVGALVAISDLAKVNKIEKYREKNMAAQARLNAVLGKKTELTRCSSRRRR